MTYKVLEDNIIENLTSTTHSEASILSCDICIGTLQIVKSSLVLSLSLHGYAWGCLKKSYFQDNSFYYWGSGEEVPGPDTTDWTVWAHCATRLGPGPSTHCQAT